jgi:hypothetical protein
VRTATEGAGVRQSAAATILLAQCYLLPAIRAGAVAEVQDVPDGLDGGPWLVTGITHHLQAGAGGSSVITGERAGAPADGPGGLLAAAVGAIGSLL